MALTSKSSVVTQAIVDLLIANQVVLGVRQVYYGDRGLLPDLPTVTVASRPKVREIRNIHKFELAFDTDVVIYHEKVQTSGTTAKANEQMAEEVEDLLNANPFLGGIVVFGFVSRVEPGVALRPGVMIAATRLTHRATSQEVF
jgi:hypothetical protein